MRRQRYLEHRLEVIQIGCRQYNHPLHKFVLMTRLHRTSSLLLE